MKIAIIEDEKVHSDLLKLYLENWSKEHGQSQQVASFETAEQFWFAYEESPDFDILFVDIQMPGMNGMELARKVREKDGDVVIVFTTGITDYLEEGYEVDAMHYLIKPLSEEKVKACLEKAVRRRKSECFVMLHTDEEVLKVNQEEINYVEARGHGCVVSLRGKNTEWERMADERGGEQKGQVRDGGISVKEKKISVRESLSELEAMLEANEFVKCHRSYLCRISNIHHIGKEDIFFDDGSAVPVSRRMYQQMNQSFIGYFCRK